MRGEAQAVRAAVATGMPFMSITPIIQIMAVIPIIPIIPIMATAAALFAVPCAAAIGSDRPVSEIAASRTEFPPASRVECRPVRIEVDRGSQRDAGAPRGSSDASEREARIAGALRHVIVEADFVDAPAEEALGALAEAAGVPMLVFWADAADLTVDGLDRDARITLAMRSSAASLLEAIVESLGGESATWQLNRGVVEVGPKAILARPSARRIRARSVDDQVLTPYSARTRRSTPEVAAAAMIDEIVRRIEPEAWLPDRMVRLHLERTGEAENPLSRTGEWASIAFRDGVLVVTAPEFVQRRIAGFEAIVPPRAADESATRPVPVVEPGSGEPGIRLRGFVPSGRRAAGDGRAGDDDALVALGRLMHARVDVRLAGAEVRDALEELAQAVGVALRVWWADEQGDHLGIEPDRRIRLRLDDASGLDALQTIVDLAAPGASSASAITWQRIGGRIEVGPRLTLARSAARRVEVIEIADVAIDRPYFVSPWAQGGVNDIVTPLERDHGLALGVERSRNGTRRKSMAFRGAEFLRFLAAHVEPIAWVPEDLALPVAREEIDPLVLDGAWASVRVRGSRLLVSAPDFVHRQIRGVPVPPSPADAAE